MISAKELREMSNNLRKVKKFFNEYCMEWIEEQMVKNAQKGYFKIEISPEWFLEDAFYVSNNKIKGGKFWNDSDSDAISEFKNMTKKECIPKVEKMFERLIESKDIFFDSEYDLCISGFSLVIKWGETK